MKVCKCKIKDAVTCVDLSKVEDDVYIDFCHYDAEEIEIDEKVMEQWKTTIEKVMEQWETAMKKVWDEFSLDELATISEYFKVSEVDQNIHKPECVTKYLKLEAEAKKKLFNK